MAICITFGTREFTSMLEGYEHVTAQCHNCGNWSARCITRWPWFTVCFIPCIPLAFHKYKEVSCHICRFSQDLKHRPDVQSQHPSASGAEGAPPHHAPPPAKYGGPPPPGGAPPAPPGGGGENYTYK